LLVVYFFCPPFVFRSGVVVRSGAVGGSCDIVGNYAFHSSGSIGHGRQGRRTTVMALLLVGRCDGKKYLLTILF
jgi:hypothetical protein